MMFENDSGSEPEVELCVEGYSFHQMRIIINYFTTKSGVLVPTPTRERDCNMKSTIWCDVEGELDASSAHLPPTMCDPSY